MSTRFFSFSTENFPTISFFTHKKQASTNIPTHVNACSPIPTEINFYKRPDGRSKTVPGLPERGLAGDGFLLLRTISHFTYEMNDNLGKNRMEANVIKLGFENN